ncbi:hypothetical protein A4G20_06250 [Pasteurellaceae bacterium RH1A]|nr:hypothetical protein A4G20_06250 [Pasteurellaceae bacterium RH1A]
MPSCPECGQPCEDIGDRCPVPPKNKTAQWQALQQDYCQLQRRIAAAYQQWRTGLQHAIERHLQQATHLGLSEIVRQDTLWQAACTALPKLPLAYFMPFHHDWLYHADAQAANSCIGTPCDKAAKLQALPANKDRQSRIDELLHDHNSLHIYDMFGQLRYSNWQNPDSPIGGERFFRRHMEGSYSDFFAKRGF